MKRVLAIILAAILLTGCGGSGASGPKTLEEFIEKYKRADWATFTSSVGGVMDEFTAVFADVANWSTDKSAYNPEPKNNGWIEYNADIILFNQPFELSVVEHSGVDASGRLIYECLEGDCFELCLEVFENIAKRKGDATTIELNDVAITETELRKAISDGIDEGSIRIRWGDIAKNNAFSISCYRYYNQKGWLTLY